MALILMSSLFVLLNAIRRHANVPFCGSGMEREHMAALSLTSRGRDVEWMDTATSRWAPQAEFITRGLGSVETYREPDGTVHGDEISAHSVVCLARRFHITLKPTAP